MHISSKQKSKHVYYKQTCKHMLIHEISRNKNKFIFIVKKTRYLHSEARGKYWIIWGPKISFCPQWNYQTLLSMKKYGGSKAEGEVGERKMEDLIIHYRKSHIWNFHINCWLTLLHFLRWNNNNNNSLSKKCSTETFTWSNLKILFFEIRLLHKDHSIVVAHSYLSTPKTHLHTPAYKNIISILMTLHFH